MPNKVRRRAVSEKKKVTVNTTSYDSFKGRLRTPEVFTSTMALFPENLRNCVNCEWSPQSPVISELPMPVIEESPDHEVVDEKGSGGPSLDPLLIRIKRGEYGQITKARIITRRRHDLTRSLYKSIRKSKKSKRKNKKSKADTENTNASSSATSNSKSPQEIKEKSKADTENTTTSSSTSSSKSLQEIKEKSSPSEVSKIRMAFENLIINQNNERVPPPKLYGIRTRSSINIKPLQQASSSSSSISKISETIDFSSSTSTGQSKSSTSSKGSRGTSNRRKLTKSAPLKIYQCPEPGCEKRFAKQSTRSHHQLTHLDEESRYKTKLMWRNVCYICLKKLSSPGMLQNHLKSHDKDVVAPSFPCPICGQQYRLKRSLSAHLKKNH